MAEATLGFAIVGAGMIAQFHADAIAAAPGARLIAVQARNLERARAFAEKNGCRAAETLDELVSDPSIRAACIATPSGLHAESAVPFLRAGKAVLCEKPLDVTRGSLDAILDAERTGGGVLAAVFQNRLGRGARALKAAIDAGRFGRFTLCSAYVKWWRDQTYYTDSGWKGGWRLDGGGALMNQGIHAVDLLQWLAGMPAQVAAFSATLAHKMEAEDTLAASLRFPNGALGVIEAATSAWPGTDLRIEIAGEKGSATLLKDQIVRWEFAEPLPEDSDIRSTADTSIGGGASDPRAISFEGHRRLVEDLTNAVREGRQPMIPGAEARKSVDLVLAIYESTRSGRVVTL